MRNLVAFVLLACWLTACGGNEGNPTGPASIKLKSRSIEVRALRMGQPIAAAAIQTSAGQGAGTSSSGMADVMASADDTLSITAPGFLSRRGVPLQGDHQVEYLWEDDDQLPLQFTQELVYGFNQDGIKHLERPIAPVLTVQADAAIMADRRMRGDLPRAIAKVNEVLARSRTGPTTNYILDEATTAPWVRIVLNPDNLDNPGERTWIYPEGTGAIRECKIEFQGTTGFWGIHLQRVLQHALTHCLGLVHAPGYPGIMGNQGVPTLDFATMEQQVMVNIFRRPPGNWAPDNAPGAAAASLRMPQRVCVQTPPA